MTQNPVKSESLSARPPALTLVDILVALTRLTLENGQNPIVPAATMEYVAAAAGITTDCLQAAMTPGESSSTEVAPLEVVPGTAPAPTPSAPTAIVAPVASAAITTPLPQMYGGPGYPPVTFPGAYLDVPAGVSVSDSTVRWYCVTVGLRVGVFPHWGNVSPYVTGVKGGACYVRYATKAEADAAFFLAVSGQRVRVITVPGATVPSITGGGQPGPPPPGGSAGDIPV